MPELQPTAHKQVLLRLGDWAAYVDHGIAPLIALLWQLGITTRASCQSFRRAGTFWIVFADRQSARRFERAGRDCMVWPTMISYRVSAKHLAEAAFTSADDPVPGTRVHTVLFPAAFAGVVKAQLRTKVGAMNGRRR